MGHLLAMQSRRSICSSVRHQTLSCHDFGLQVVQNSIQSITKIWGVLQQRVYSAKIQTVDELQQHIIEEWECLDQRVIDNAVIQWCRMSYSTPRNDRLSHDCERRSFRTVTVEHPTESVMLYDQQLLCE